MIRAILQTFAACAMFVGVGCASPSNPAPVAEVPAPPPLTIALGKGIPPAPVQAVAQLPDGTIAIGTRLGLALWRDGQAKVHYGRYIEPGHGYDFREVPGNSVLPHANIAALLVDRRGTLWIGTGSGLCRMVAGELSNVTRGLPATWRAGENVEVPIDKDTSEITGPANEHAITALFERADGTIVIGTRNAGVIFHDPVADAYKLIKRAPDMNKWVTSIAEDAAGTLWIATCGEGVTRVDDGVPKPVALDKAWGDPGRVSSLAVSREGVVWISIGERLIAAPFSEAPKVFRTADLFPDLANSYNHILHVQIDRQGRVWAFGFSGVAVLDGKTWRYPQWNDSDYSGYGSLLFEGKEGVPWLTDLDALTRAPTITWHDQPPAARKLARVRAAIEKEYPAVKPVDHAFVAVDGLGRAWLASGDTLLAYHNRQWSDMKPMLQEKEANIAFLHADSKRRLWIGTSGSGILLLDGDKQQTLNMQDPDHSRTVAYCMTEAANGDVWVGTQNGLYVMAGDQWKQMDETTQTSEIAIDSRGRIWYADFNYGLFMLEDGKPKPLSHTDNALGGFMIISIERTGDGQVKVEAARESPHGSEERTVICDGKTMTVVP